jgi:small subunit ribosomal protein S5e
MSDNGEVEVDSPAGYYQVIPKDIQTDSVRLFGKWSYVSIAKSTLW